MREIRRVLDRLNSERCEWATYDIIANWAIEIIKVRKEVNHEINIQMVVIIKYVTTNVGRFGIKSIANKLKRDSLIDGHIRSQLIYHDGY